MDPLISYTALQTIMTKARPNPISCTMGGRNTKATTVKAPEEASRIFAWGADKNLGSLPKSFSSGSYSASHGQIHQRTSLGRGMSCQYHHFFDSLQLASSIRGADYFSVFPILFDAGAATNYSLR